ncbi:MAG: hypothetical protein FWG99_01880 [Treponema sp.]|nr:hypothetical protein [Treponema sp.]
MNKKFVYIVIFFLAFSSVVFAGRNEINEALDSYEAIVVEVEEMAQNEYICIVCDFSAIDEKMAVANDRIGKLEDEREWLVQDAKRAAELRSRFVQAMAAAMKVIIKY